MDTRTFVHYNLLCNTTSLYLLIRLIHIILEWTERCKMFWNNSAKATIFSYFKQLWLGTWFLFTFQYENKLFLTVQKNRAKEKENHQVYKKCINCLVLGKVVENATITLNFKKHFHFSLSQISKQFLPTILAKCFPRVLSIIGKL